MPISPIVLQRRHAELGRIRLGAKRGGNGAPMKLESFRFTSHSERYIRDLAELYGGEARPWDNKGVASWEVFTDATSIPVIAVKGGLSQWMETWSGGGVAHRCDGETNALTGDPCDPNDKAHVDAKPTTRLSVMLPELEAIGVFRLETHGWNAAAEIPAVAELAQYVGDLVPANLHLVERRSVKDGKTSRFVVPVLDLQIGTARLKEIVAQKSGAGLELTSGQPSEQRAISSGPAQAPAAGQSDVVLPTLADITAATTPDAVYAMHRFLTGHGALTAELDQACRARVTQLQAPAEQVTAADRDDVAAQMNGDPDVLWQSILATAGSFDEPWTTSQVIADFEGQYAIHPSEATADQLQAYHQLLKNGVTA